MTKVASASKQIDINRESMSMLTPGEAVSFLHTPQNQDQGDRWRGQWLVKTSWCEYLPKERYGGEVKIGPEEWVGLEVVIVKDGDRCYMEPYIRGK